MTDNPPSTMPKIPPRTVFETPTDSFDRHHPLASAGEVTVGSASERGSVADFVVDIPNRVRLTLEDVPANVDGLKQLMTRGCWRSTIKLVDKMLDHETKYPHDAIALRFCKIVAHMQMKQYKAASDELDVIGDFDALKNSYETYPQHYPNIKGSMVPFSLRITKAELAYFLKTDASLDLFYQLLAFCRNEITHLKTHGHKLAENYITDPSIIDAVTSLPSPSSSHFRKSAAGSITTSASEDPLRGPYTESLELWTQRETKIIFTIITRFIQEREFPLAIQLLQEQVTKHPTDPNLLSSLGRLYLQMGSVKSAIVAFKAVETLISDPDSPLVHMNSGYISLASDQFTTAIQHFQAVIEKNPKDLAATNNKAICLLYTCDLSGAIATLEDLIKKDPEESLHEVIVFNLCTLYDLKSDNNADKKKAVMSVAAKFAPDSFDFSVLKL
eukprot:TRINITY_DN7614_c0_g1_i1.p1 TRINITY_DN7614_c0_g1~~TRINITY_DN7614_c0_g1_i1.p1  ORF type:complete len:443 (-),score=102.42 TRINITY_DN7614_c0_g1_i1:39-1367(-)